MEDMNYPAFERAGAKTRGPFPTRLSEAHRIADIMVPALSAPVAPRILE